LRVPFITVYIFLSLASMSCIGSECLEISRREAFRTADVVFRGTVNHIEHLESVETAASDKDNIPLRSVDPADPQLVSFTVSKAWKGPVTKTMRVFVWGRPSLGSGYQFRVGVDYVVYAQKENTDKWPSIVKAGRGSPVYGLGICPMRIRADANKESQALGKAGVRIE